ncbi:uncharacterized protein LOC130103060 [Rhinichthys klamathensis goyatoka]|uniref:uncharacterized protein LOC130103060 n=1 Tax=Rhinichthys klamathensis goyatoka TaxID=3034132 RepID=UPI0024B5FA2F|nr:uncharacterized protein LOC130103060 [Rhinichthys klamathensis goyatoka]
MLPPEEQEKQNAWFYSVEDHKTAFVEETNKWLLEAPEAPAEGVVAPCLGSAVFDDEACIGKPVENVDDDVRPSDSVSNVSLRSKRFSTVVSKPMSTTSSARIRAEAETAALMARQKLLSKKHALEEQQEVLRRKKEVLEMDMELAASMAKMSVFKVSEGSRASHVSVELDGMNSYVERGKSTQLSHEAAIFVPEFNTQPLVSELVDDVSRPSYASVRSKTYNTSQLPTVATSAGRLTLPTLPAAVTRVDQHTLPEGVSNPPITHLQYGAAPVTVSDSDQRFLTVLERQNQITSLLVGQQSLFLLPKRDLQVFDGDPLQYQTFIRGFEHNIEARTQSQTDCLYYLEQYTRGQPRDLIRSCQHLPPSHGYSKAKSLLQEHFGDPFKVASAYMDKVLSWPMLKAEDVKALRAYSLLLRECCNSMGVSASDLNVPTNMQIIVKKLPYKLRDYWRSVACDIYEKFHRRATFSDIVEFVERQVKMASDPLFGNIQETFASGRNEVKMVRSQPSSKVRGSSFATTVAPAENNMEPGFKREKNSLAKFCLFCGAGHSLDACFSLDKRTQDEKISFLKENRMCFGCLCVGHMSKDCRKRMTCKVCNNRHPTLLHIHPTAKPTSPTQANGGLNMARDGAVVSVQSSGLTGAGKQDCTLSILPVQVKSKRGQETVVTYAFLDPGSTASFCTERLMTRLNLTGKKLGILLRTMGQEKVVDSYKLSDLEVAGLDSNNFCGLSEIFTQQNMPVHRGNIPSSKDLQRWPHLRHIKIPEINSDVDLLIGTNVPQALEPWEVVRAENGGPYAIKTILGWTVNGPLHGDCHINEQCLQPDITVNRISVARLDELWEKQLKVDFPETLQDEQPGLSVEDKRFNELVSESTKLIDGHYSIGLPVKQRHFKMPNNKTVAEQRALSLKRRLNKDPSFSNDYIAFMSKMLVNGYAERVPTEQSTRCDGRVWYIPHHGVYHPKKKKLRVVFDCGVTFQGTSLNSQLLQGPDLTNLLVGVLTRFRKEPVVLIGDIEAMYHQVRVPAEDSDLLRFLWWPDGDCSRELVEYRMTVHLFGATSSPSCACFALRKCAEDNQRFFSSNAVNTVLHHFYVDDCLVSIGSEEEAVFLRRELSALCAEGGFKLTKWVSNRRTVLATIPQDERAKEVKDLDLNSDALPIEYVLGVQWCVQSDSFKFKITLKTHPLTRRGILRSLGWDEPLPSSVTKEWTAWLEELHELESWEVSRCLKPVDFGFLVSAQLHHFADASEEGFGTVTYLLLHDDRGRTHSVFIMGKARVAPLKLVTIPRMELTAAVMASRMDKLWRKELQMDLQESVFWTDSTSVLKYINNVTSRFKIFISNRVSEILKISNASQWRYVNTLTNPADLASRGVKVQSLLKTGAWLCGPDFLHEPESSWPQNPETLENTLIGDPEVKAVMVNAAQVEQVSPVEKLIDYFSSWLRLKRAVGWLLKVKTLLLSLVRHRKLLRGNLSELDQSSEQLEKELQVQMEGFKAQVPKGVLSMEDMVVAESSIICFCQKTMFPEELANLKKGECVRRTSHLYKLNPILDGDLIRVGGRLSRAAMPAEAKHPVILAKDKHISNLILRHVHQVTGHGGRNHMLSHLRQKYWIPGACAAIRKVLAKCVICRRLSASPGHQKMADLPYNRITPDEPPFSRVGLDCFGPFEVDKYCGVYY